MLNYVLRRKSDRGPGIGQRRTLGGLHADQGIGHSFILDVIEPLRSVVDWHLLTMLEGQTFGKLEVFETRQGAGRLMPPLAQAFAELAPGLAKLAAPVVEQVAPHLADGWGTTTQPLTIPTLLTEANRGAGRDGVRMQPKRKDAVALEVPKVCTACGVVLERRDRDHCDACLPEELRNNAMTFREKGRTELEVLRAASQDPAHNATANQRRGTKVDRAQREFRAWDAAHDSDADREVFRREILPGLQGVSLSAMVKATGLSEG